MTEHQHFCDVGIDRQPHATVVAVRGEVDLFAAPALRAALAQAHTFASPVLVDLSACTFLDSSGLHALLSAAGDRDDVLLACPPGGVPARLLDVMVPGRFRSHPTREAALAGLAAA